MPTIARIRRAAGVARLGTMQIAYIAAVRDDLGLAKRSAG
jgi:hypothetical protein